MSDFWVCVRDCFPLEGSGQARKVWVMREASRHASRHEHAQRLLQLCEQNIETGKGVNTHRRIRAAVDYNMSDAKSFV